MQYRPEVDGLRTLAVLPVVLYHAHAPGFSGGFAGVDIFFVISGYLITSIIHAELQAGKFSIARFYERRMRRLLPALFVVLAASVAFSVAWMSPTDAQDFFKSLIAVPLFGSNYYFAASTGYFANTAESMPLLHTWSLAVEEQYYVFFPVFMILAWRLMRGRIVILIGIGLALSLAFALVYVDRAPDRAFFSMPSRCWELLMGAMAAFHLERHGHQSPPDWKRQAASLLGFVLAVGVMTVKSPFAVPGLYSLLPTVGAVLIILFAWPGTYVHKLLSHRLPVAIGMLSYSLYLWHQPLMALARVHFIDANDGALMLGAVLLSFALAYLTWRFVEGPFRERDRYRASALVPAAVAGSILFVAMGVAVLNIDYTAWRYGKEKAATAHAIWTTVKPEHDCLQGYPEITAKGCALGAPHGGKTVAVIGDSHAAQWADALHRMGQDNGVRVILFAKGACAAANVQYWYYALRRDYWECGRWRTEVLRKITDLHVDAILVTNYSSAYTGANGHVALAEWRTGVKAFVQDLQPHTRQVIWLIDNPHFASNPFVCFEANFWHDETRPCSVPRAQAIDRDVVAAERDVLANLPAVTVADFNDFFCDADRCISLVEQKPIMRDGNHLTARATFMLQQRLEHVLRQAL